MRAALTVVVGFAGAVLGLAGACTKFDSSEGDPDAGATSTSSTSSSSGSSGSSGTSDASGNDAASKRPIVCGNGTTCDATEEQACCDAYDGGGACVPAKTCTRAPGRFLCDSTGDCPKGQLCCVRDSQNEAFSECAEKCGALVVPMCDLTKDCPNDGDSCIEASPALPNGYRICKR